MLPQANLGGELVREAGVRSSCVYSLAAGRDPDLLVAAGASAWMDLLHPSLQHSHPALQFPA